MGTLPSSSGTKVLVLEKADDEAPCLLHNCRPSHIQQASAVKHWFVFAGLFLLARVFYLTHCWYQQGWLCWARTAQPCWTCWWGLLSLTLTTYLLHAILLILYFLYITICFLVRQCCDGRWAMRQPAGLCCQYLLQKRLSTWFLNDYVPQFYANIGTILIIHNDYMLRSRIHALTLTSLFPAFFFFELSPDFFAFMSGSRFLLLRSRVLLASFGRFPCDIFCNSFHPPSCLSFPFHLLWRRPL